MALTRVEEGQEGVGPFVVHDLARSPHPSRQGRNNVFAAMDPERPVPAPPFADNHPDPIDIVEKPYGPPDSCLCFGLGRKNHGKHHVPERSRSTAPRLSHCPIMRPKASSNRAGRAANSLRSAPFGLDGPLSEGAASRSSDVGGHRAPNPPGTTRLRRIKKRHTHRRSCNSELREAEHGQTLRQAPVLGIRVRLGIN